MRNPVRMAKMKKAGHTHLGEDGKETAFTDDAGGDGTRNKHFGKQLTDAYRV